MWDFLRKKFKTEPTVSTMDPTKAALDNLKGAAEDFEWSKRRMESYEINLHKHLSIAYSLNIPTVKINNALGIK